MTQHARFYLPRDDKAFDANLSELCAQGWELVSFIGGWHPLPQYHFREDGHLQQIEAIFRRKDALSDSQENKAFDARSVCQRNLDNQNKQR